MTLVNKISGDKRTFWDIVESIFMIEIQSGNASSRIDIVLTTQSKQQSVRAGEKLPAKPMVILMLVSRNTVEETAEKFSQ